MPRKKNERKIVTIDCETNPFEYSVKVAPFVWGFFDGETYAYFWNECPEKCSRDLMDYLESEEEGTIVYAHNGGKFDFMFLLQYLDSDIMMINGRIAKATLFDGRIELRDSLLILPIALEQYKKTEIDYMKFKPGVRSLHKNEIIRYLRDDCADLHTLVTEFIKNFGLNLTLAGTAFKEVKNTGYEITKTSAAFDDKFRPYYFGGRVQCFRVGNFYGDFKYVDINSAYPKAMTERHWFGAGTVEHVRLPEKENGSWYATVTGVSKGALPLRHKEKESDTSKLFFPDDDTPRTYHASGWEINKGLETGTLKIDKVLKVHKPAMLNDFTCYVEKFFDWKRQAEVDGDLIMRIFAKILLNSAYGKFAQDGRRFKKCCIVPVGEWPDNDAKWCASKRWRWVEDIETGHSIFERDDPQDLFFNVATAASITANVRAYLWGSILQSDTPLYCDTDSIVCRKFNGPMGDKLGEWSMEAELSEAHIAQRKMYALKTKDGEHRVASKGVRLDFDQIKNGISKGEIVTFKKESPSFSLRHGQRFIPRKINFENLNKNIATTPESYYSSTTQ